MKTKILKPQKSFNGPALLAGMFRELDPHFRKQLYRKLEKHSPLLVAFLQKTEFLFQDLVRLENRSIQALLVRISEQQWCIAWKLGDETLRRRLLDNMSEGRRRAFLEALENQAKVPKALVHQVQTTIANKAREMLLRGELRLKSRRRKYQGTASKKVEC